MYRQPRQPTLSQSEADSAHNIESVFIRVRPAETSAIAVSYNLFRDVSPRGVPKRVPPLQFALARDFSVLPCRAEKHPVKESI
jgi:hypothetical protein